MKFSQIISLGLLGLSLGFAVYEAGAVTVTWASGVTNYWDNTNSWSDQTVPAHGNDVVITNIGAQVLLTNSTANLSSLIISNAATLIFSNWDTKLSATNITIATNTVLTLPAAYSNGVMSNRVWIACSNLTVAQGGSINVNGKGYARGTPSANGQGPGGGTTGGNAGAGGSHGGTGGGGYNGGAGSTYGLTNAPEYPGSGGGGSTIGYYGTHGGGAVRIEATGLVTVNGVVTADGAGAAGGNRSGTGSGGSIYITCNSFTGTNSIISATGGGCDGPGNIGGGGGGGRIAIVYTQPAALPPSIVFWARLGTNSYGGSDPGTLYFTDSSLLNPAWLAHSGVVYIPGFTNWSMDNFTMTNGWLDFPITPALRLTVTNAMTVSGSATRLRVINGAITCGNLALTNSATFYLGSASTKTNAQSLTCTGNLVLSNSCALYITPAETNALQTNLAALVSVAGDFSMYSGSTLVPYSARTNGASVLLRMRNLTVNAGSTISANSAGYAGASSQTTGYGPGKGGANTVDSWFGGAGGYGGQGGAGKYGSGAGATYGNSNAPTEPGSGGGGGSYGMYGGGLVRAEVVETATVNGTITANGGTGNNNAGSGSGGGIYIRCRLFTGSTNGSLLANGGVGAAGGGGGRIAVWRMYHTFAGSTSVTNGTGSYTSGQPGTVYWGVINPPGTIFSAR